MVSAPPDATQIVGAMRATDVGKSGEDLAATSLTRDQSSG